MKVLIACEYSGIVSAAFVREGWQVTSCDLLPTEAVGISNHGSFRHYIGDVFDVIDAEPYDLLVGFPPCTFLCQAQMFRTIKPKFEIKTLLAYNFVLRLFFSRIKHVAIENPVGWLNTNFRKPDQITSPHMFGSPYSKKVCLWLKNLPQLIEGQPSPGLKKVNNHTNSRMTQEERSKIRSKFFPELADAMAVQWTDYIIKNRLIQGQKTW